MLKEWLGPLTTAVAVLKGAGACVFLAACLLAVLPLVAGGCGLIAMIGEAPVARQLWRDWVKVWKRAWRNDRSPLD